MHCITKHHIISSLCLHIFQLDFLADDFKKYTKYYITSHAFVCQNATMTRSQASTCYSLLNQLFLNDPPNSISSNCLIPITFSPLLTPASQTPLTLNLPPPAPLSSTLLPSRHSTRHPPIVWLDPLWPPPPTDGEQKTKTFCKGTPEGSSCSSHFFNVILKEKEKFCF